MIRAGTAGVTLFAADLARRAAGRSAGRTKLIQALLDAIAEDSITAVIVARAIGAHPFAFVAGFAGFARGRTRPAFATCARFDTVAEQIIIADDV